MRSTKSVALPRNLWKHLRSGVEEFGCPRRPHKPKIVGSNPTSATRQDGRPPCRRCLQRLSECAPSSRREVRHQGNAQGAGILCKEAVEGSSPSFSTLVWSRRANRD